MSDADSDSWTDAASRVAGDAWDNLRRNARLSPPEIDDFAVIIGAMKSGTTSLFEYLADHPAISPCRTGEPNFFSRADNWERGLDWYRDHWLWEDEHKWALEGSTNYAKGFKFEGTPRRLAEARDRGLNFRFIYLLRHPLDRLVSQYNHSLRAGWKQPPDDPDSPYLVLDDHLIDISRYAAQLDLFMEEFDREDFRIVLFEDLIERPAETVESVCRFLEIDDGHSFSNLGEAYNVNDRPMVASPAWRKLRSHDGFDRLFRRHVPHGLRLKLRRMLADEHLDEPYVLSDEQRGIVLDELADDLRRLRDHYGVDISVWELLD